LGEKRNTGALKTTKKKKKKKKPCAGGPEVWFGKEKTLMAWNSNWPMVSPKARKNLNGAGRGQ